MASKNIQSDNETAQLPSEVFEHKIPDNVAQSPLEAKQKTPSKDGIDATGEVRRSTRRALTNRKPKEGTAHKLGQRATRTQSRSKSRGRKASTRKVANRVPVTANGELFSSDDEYHPPVQNGKQKHIHQWLRTTIEHQESPKPTDNDWNTSNTNIEDTTTFSDEDDIKPCTNGSQVTIHPNERAHNSIFRAILFILLLLTTVAALMNSISATLPSELDSGEQAHQSWIWLQKIKQKIRISPDAEVKLSAALQRHLETPPKRPVAVIVAGTQERTNNFLAVAGMVIGNGTVEDIHTEDYASSNAKQSIQTILQRYFQGGGRVVIFDDILRMKQPLVELLHNFCDNQDAPFIQAIYLLQVISNETLTSASQWDSKARATLLAKWNAIGVDKPTAEAALSRIGDHTVWI